MAGRFGATIEQVGKDLGEGIEGKDLVTDSLRAVRNVGVATWHAMNGVIPSVANAFSGQEYQVVRRTGAVEGTTTAVRKVFATKGFIGKASAVLAELPDGPVDDAFNLVGGGKWIIKPVGGAQARLAA